MGNFVIKACYFPSVQFYDKRPLCQDFCFMFRNLTLKILHACLGGGENSATMLDLDSGMGFYSAMMLYLILGGHLVPDTFYI